MVRMIGFVFLELFKKEKKVKIWSLCMCGFIFNMYSFFSSFVVCFVLLVFCFGEYSLVSFVVFLHNAFTNLSHLSERSSSDYSQNKTGRTTVYVLPSKCPHLI